MPFQPADSGELPPGDSNHTEIASAAEIIIRRRPLIAPGQSLLVALTGIDGSGKGYLARAIVEQLLGRGLAVATINVDGWLNLPAKRFSKHDPARHFYRHALRLDEMFDQLILPLRATRSYRVVMNFAEETAHEYRKQPLKYDDIDVILVEGIYLLKRAYYSRYDLSFWVDCSFETALERAIQRAQEGLSPEETIRAYETIYFPAQRIHFDLDAPRASATHIICNDPRLRPREPITQAAMAGARS